MTPTGKKVAAALLLALLALPTGVCSLFFTPMGFTSMGRGSFEHDIGVFMLLCSAVGWTICGLTIWGAIRLTRSANLQNSPGDLPP
jgi:hypothetical protein